VDQPELFDEGLNAAIKTLVSEIVRVLSQNQQSSKALTIEEVMERTGMSRSWLYINARERKLPFAKKLGRRICFDSAALERWLARR
jgi:excisionase family DNA binding protein